VNDVVLDEPLAASIRVAMRDRDYTNVAAFEDVYIADAGKNRFHPIKNYFSSLVWDGKNHILNLSKYIEDNHEPIPGPHETARSVAHVWLLRWLIGAVAKVMQKGAQNPMLVWFGDQDLGKSTFALWLCSPLPAMHEESSIDPDNKEDVRKLSSKFIWEVGELGATTRRADVEALKAFITRMDVTYRVPYAKHAVTVPACASFIGTVNPTVEGFLNDESGSRRFLVMEINKIDWAYSTDIDVNQLWAQAYHLYLAGEPWRLLPNEVAKRKEINQAHEIVDPLEDFFHTYYMIDPALSDDNQWRIDPTHIMEHLRDKGFKDSDRQLATRMGVTLKRLGVERIRVRMGEERPRFYVGIRRKSQPDIPSKGYVSQSIE
jgi:putative DNA primase/helicase